MGGVKSVLSPRRWHSTLWRFVLLAAVQVLPAGAVQAADKLVLTAGVLAPYTTPERQGFLDQMVRAVFREVGLDAELLIYPMATERGMLNANEGVDDGLAMRVAGLEKQYPNLIRVPEPIAINDFVALTTRLRFPTKNWDSLQPYVVGYIIGWKVFEQNVPSGRQLTLVRDADQLFNLLASGRVDVALYERWQGLARTRAMGLQVQAMEPPLVRTPMYIYLNKKHAELVPRVAQALVKLKRNGTYARIHDATLGKTAP
jgi:polar amino acid transport system substrate-binding protein